MSELKEVASFMYGYGDVRACKGSGYSHPLWEIHGLTEEQLLWVPVITIDEEIVAGFDQSLLDSLL